MRLFACAICLISSAVFGFSGGLGDRSVPVQTRLAEIDGATIAAYEKLGAVYLSLRFDRFGELDRTGWMDTDEWNGRAVTTIPVFRLVLLCQLCPLVNPPWRQAFAAFPMVQPRFLVSL